MNLQNKQARFITRRHFLSRCNAGLGMMALSSLLGKSARASAQAMNPLAPKAPSQLARAKHVIYLDMSGAPPQHDLFDYKPTLNRLNGTPCPAELLKGERFAFIKGTPKVLGSPYKFKQHGNSGTGYRNFCPTSAEWSTRSRSSNRCIRISLTTPPRRCCCTPETATGLCVDGIVDYLWAGLESQNLPGFVVLVSGGTDPTGGKSLWGSGYLPSVFQGVQCRSKGEPILYVSDPKGMDRQTSPGEP